MLAAGCQRLREFGAGIALAALDLGELINEPPRAAVEVGHDGLTLSVEAEPGLSLLICADPVIGDKPAEMRAHEAIVLVGSERPMAAVPGPQLSQPS